MGKNKKGFTLIELLAVIVVLAIIMVIATQQVTKTINTARVNAFNSSYKIIEKEIKNRIDMEKLGYTSQITCDDTDGDNSNDCSKIYEISEDDYTMVVKADDAGGYQLILTGKEKFESIDFKENTNLPANTVAYSSTGVSDKKDSVIAKITSDGKTEKVAEDVIQQMEKQQLLISYHNTLKNVAKYFFDNKKSMSSTSDYIVFDPILNDTRCPNSVLISIKRNTNGIYDLDKLNIADQDLNDVRDNNICYSKGNNNLIITCLNEDGSLKKPNSTYCH